MHSTCIVEQHVTVRLMYILSVAQHCFYGKFMSTATTQRTTLTLPYAALTQKNVRLLTAFFIRIIRQSRSQWQACRCVVCQVCVTVKHFMKSDGINDEATTIKYYAGVCMCVRACVCMCVCACVCACMCVYVRTRPVQKDTEHLK